MDDRDPTVKRRYHQDRRARQAASRRRAIRDAATDAFLRDGYGATTMRQIAAAAGVGERTLYDAFATKERLFLHVANAAIGGDERPVTVVMRPEFQDAIADRDPAAAIQTFARFSAAILERAGPIIMVAVQSAGADPAMRRFADDGAVATRDVVAAFVDHLADIHPVGDLQTTTASALAIVSPHVHQILRTHGGLGADDYRAWLADTLAATILKQAPRVPTTRIDHGGHDA